jgi:hypothetical protein
VRPCCLRQATGLQPAGQPPACASSQRLILISTHQAAVALAALRQCSQASHQDDCRAESDGYWWHNFLIKGARSMCEVQLLLALLAD